MQDTMLGPLCGEHASLCKEDADDDVREKSMDGPEARSKKRRKVRAPAPSAIEVQEKEQTLEEGIWVPSRTEALKKEKRGLHAGVALRTFPDAEPAGEAAGSIWLSSDKATAANRHGGLMRIFDTTEDIFENIEEARTWIQDQGRYAIEKALKEEAETRWQVAQEKSKRKGIAKKAGEKRGRGAGGGGGRGRGGRGGGARGGGRGKRGDSQKDKSQRNGSRDEGPGDREDEEGEGEGPSSRRFRRSRRTEGGRGGLRSGAVKMLDKQQKRIEQQLFPLDAEQVVIYDFDVPDMKRVLKIPLPGSAQALTTSKDASHVLSFANDMQAVLAERTFKSFDAFSLAELMEFQETV